MACLSALPGPFKVAELRMLGIIPMSVRWATKKAGGSSKNGRKSSGKRLGLKKGDGELHFTLQGSGFHVYGKTPEFRSILFRPICHSW